MMRMKQLYFFVALLITTNSFAQTEKKVSSTLFAQANRTLYDRTTSNNRGGVGLGLQTNINTPTLAKPVVEVSADLFAGTKELYVTEDDKPIDAKSGVFSIYAGALLHSSHRLFLSTTGGISLFNGKGHLGVRPSLGYHLSKNGRFAAKASFTHIFQRDAISNQSFGYGSFALGVKLF